MFRILIQKDSLCLSLTNNPQESEDVYSWGQGTNGRLGHGNEVSHLTPKVLEAMLGRDIRAIACGPTHSAAINASGQLFTWGAGK